MAAIVSRTTRDLVSVTGPEAITWLQGQLSQDIAGLTVDEVSWTFVLAPQGKVEGWGRIQRTGDDAVRIDVDAGAGDRWRTRLERFKLGTKADITVHTDVPILAVRGALPKDALPAAGPQPDGGDLLPATDDPDPAAGTWIDARLEALLADGVEQADENVLTAHRIRAGAPVWGAELDEDTIPATIGQWAIDASVSFTKGCYTGQELVARIDSRGGNVPRRLVAVTATDPGSTTAGSSIVVDGTDRGQVTSASTDDGGGLIALAYLHRAVEVPATGTIDGVEVDLRPLPVR